MVANTQKARVEPFIEGAIESDTLRVGSRYKSDGRFGPVADISIGRERDGTPSWLYIVTDQYEGAVMLDISTLPLLLKALRRVEKHLAHKSAPSTSGGDLH